MSNPINPQTIQRESLLFAYTSALERGDFARLAEILNQASLDEILQRQILEIHAALPSGPSPQPQSNLQTLWRRIQNAGKGLRHTPIWGPMVAVLGLVLVVVVTIQAVIGPAVGNIFSNIVSYGPHTPFAGENRQYNQLATQTPNSPYYQPFSVQSTPTPYLPGAYDPYPAPVISTQPVESGHMIGRSASLSIRSTDTHETRKSVVSMVARYAPEGAFVVSDSETSYTGNPDMPTIVMVLRVPVGHYDECMAQLVTLGTKVLQRQENAQDVTQEYVDVSARIEALRTSRARLIEIIKNAENTDDLLRAEAELSQRETELEAAVATQKYLEKTTALSSISLNILPVIPPQPISDSSWKPSLTFTNAARVLLSSLRAFADWLIYFSVATLPWLVLIGLVIYGAVALLNKLARK